MSAESLNTVSRWRTRPVFLSSTFKDMQAERDYLRNIVMPRLEEELRKRRHHLDWIDLRQGVESGTTTSEEQRELLVLKTCLAEIERSRPFIVVLLGDRYGWVPPAERMEAASREAGLQIGTIGKSVTALEIEFGILKKSQELRRHCFFYLREPLPYEVLPKELRADYSEQFAADDQAAARCKALNELKARLNTDPELKSRIRTYKGDWDTKENRVTSLEAWGEMVFQDLWQELDIETRVFAAAPAPTWKESERATLAEFVEQRSRDFTGRTETISSLLAIAKSPIGEGTSWAVGVTGRPGSGKSALFAELHCKLEADPGVFLLANAAGATIRGASVDSMLRRWIAELATFLEVSDPLPEKATVENVDQAFRSLLGNASMKKRVVVLLDALDQLEPTPRAQFLTWRPEPWPPNAKLIATTVLGTQSGNLAQMAGVSNFELPPLTSGDACSIARRIWQRWHVPWSDDVWQTLNQKQLADKSLAVGNPLWTALACEQLALLDADDFARAEKQFAEEVNPQTRLIRLRHEIAERMPPDVCGIYRWLFEHAERIHGKKLVRSFLVAITLSRHGWRESDLQLLMPRLSDVLDNGLGILPKNLVFDTVMRLGLRRFDPKYTGESRLPIGLNCVFLFRSHVRHLENRPRLQRGKLIP